jgi:hypothetical protein
MQPAIRHPQSAIMAFLFAVVLPAKAAWDYVVGAARIVNGNGLPTKGNRRPQTGQHLPMRRVRCTSAVAQDEDGLFTIYAADWLTELGTLTCRCEFGAYPANARAAAFYLGGDGADHPGWAAIVRECEVSL